MVNSMKLHSSPQIVSHIDAIQISKIEATKLKIKEQYGSSLSQDEIRDMVESTIHFNNSINFIYSEFEDQTNLTLFHEPFSEQFIPVNDVVIGVGKFSQNEANWSDISNGLIENPKFDDDSIKQLDLIAANIRRKLNTLIK